MTGVTTGQGEWRSNWRLLLCCVLGVPVPTVAFYALGQFLGPLEHEFGWSRTQASAGLSLSLVLGFLASPLVGRLVDKVNARWLVLPGLVLVGLALASFSLTTSSTGLWIAIWCFHSLVGVLVGPVVWLTVISAAFDQKRSMAIALVLCGSGIAAALGPVSARLLIDAFGWRSAFQVFSLLWTVPPLILAYLFFHDRRSQGGRADVSHETQAPPPSLRAAYLSANFIKLALAVTAAQTALAAYMIHLAPAIAEKGLTLSQAATAAGFAGLFSIPGKLGIGYLFDRAGQTAVALGIMLILAAASIMLAVDSSSLAAAFAATCMLGLASGSAVTFVACLCRRLFAAEIFGSIYGAVTSLSALAGAMGPFAASAIHDATGSYALAFWLGVGTAIVAALLLASLSTTPALREAQPA